MDVCEIYHARGQVADKELRTATYNELLELKTLVDKDIGDIRFQIDQVKADKVSTGVYADPHWYRSAMRAKGIKGQLSQRIQVAIAHQKRNKSKQTGEGKELKALLIALDLVLSPDQKALVMTKWKEICFE